MIHAVQIAGRRDTVNYRVGWRLLPVCREIVTGLLRAVEAAQQFDREYRAIFGSPPRYRGDPWHRPVPPYRDPRTKEMGCTRRRS